ncbi:hypothetical protein [Hydrogenophaga sp. BPS33]|uniref:hypothetical protein n=1 Tax=Hydrogenophaga sp. BPS33 TaxID=2651974 RepID=UPI00131FEF56|nr:hypothetical protein [Hydrogenophaga sp. BPS33]QHE85207.1 hypothetical protein F9K07_10055 [Hydrogenophaga sp. BPS33]
MSTSTASPTHSLAAPGKTPLHQEAGTDTAKNTAHRRRANADAAEQPRKPLRQRFIDVVNPSTKKRIENVSRAAIKKVDMHVAQFLHAVASGGKDGEKKAMQEVFKIHGVLAPMKNEYHNKVGSWHELFGERLAHRKCALKHLGVKELHQLEKNLNKFSLVHQNDALKQLGYSIKAELLRRQFEGFHWGILAPQANTRPFTVLAGRALDELQAMAKELLQNAPAAKSYKGDEPEIPGTLFTRTELQTALAALVAARQLRDEAKSTVEALAATESKRPISERPIDEVMVLKKAVDHMVNIDGVGPGEELKRMKSELDARVVGYEKRIETLLKGPVARFDARQWTNGKLVDLKEKIRELPDKHPTRAYLEDAIQTDIARRKLQVRNEFGHALSAALNGNPSEDALHGLLVAAANKWAEASALFEQLNEHLSRNEFTQWISSTLTRHILNGPQALGPLQRLQNLVGTLQDQLQKEGTSSPFLDLLSSCFQATSTAATGLAPKKRKPKGVATQTRADKNKNKVPERVATTGDGPKGTPRKLPRTAANKQKDATEAPREMQDVAKIRKPPTSVTWSLAEARVQVKLARQLGVDKRHVPELQSLLMAITVVIRETQDPEDLLALSEVFRALKRQGSVDASVLRELSALANEKLANLPPT